MQKKKIQIMDLIQDTSIMVRDVNPYISANYADAMRGGDVFPPLIVDKKNRIICGNTRFDAYKKVYEPEHKVDCLITDETKDVDLIILAAQDNSRHGYQMTPFEKRKVIARLRQNKVDDERISKILGISGHRLEKWADMNVTVIGSNGKRHQEPVKNGYKHLSGQKVAQEEYDNHEVNDMGIPVKTLARRLTTVLSRGDKWIKLDGELIEQFEILIDYLSAYVARNKNKIEEGE